mmetsp:Transcript_57180/g.94998  ORF Transcript_57180/g.94998 Transcript_57180/m.94998 type:complete len:217 (-) Transcript_57180:136-786(-)
MVDVEHIRGRTETAAIPSSIHRQQLQTGVCGPRTDDEMGNPTGAFTTRRQVPHLSFVLVVCHAHYRHVQSTGVGIQQNIHRALRLHEMRQIDVVVVRVPHRFVVVLLLAVMASNAPDRRVIEVAVAEHTFGTHSDLQVLLRRVVDQDAPAMDARLDRLDVSNRPCARTSRIGLITCFGDAMVVCGQLEIFTAAEFFAEFDVKRDTVDEQRAYLDGG